MSEEIKLPEKLLYDVWQKQKFSQEIITTAGEKIEILYCGDFDAENGGPDFKNARIRIGGITYVGDVEIDTHYSDWKTHGHNLNSRFNKVILHATFESFDQPKFVYTKEGRKIPSIGISSFLDESIFNIIRDSLRAEPDTTIQKMPCQDITSLMDENERIDYLVRLGTDRFNKKCERVLHRLRELLYVDELTVREPDVRYSLPPEYENKQIEYRQLKKTDIWLQLFYEGLFEALGYTQNKLIMTDLAKAVDVKFLHAVNAGGNFRDDLESVYFNVGGLLNNDEIPDTDESSEYLRKIHEIWVKYRDLYTGPYFHEEEWTLSKLRPQNYPAIRLAGGIHLLDALLNHGLLDTLVKKFTEIHNYDVLRNSVRSLFIVKADGYWSRHFKFDKNGKFHIKYFVGSSRADEIFINIILPFMYVYFDLFGKKKLASKVFGVYKIMKAESDNNLVNDIARALKLEEYKHKTIINQGMIELFRTHCAKDRCDDCFIGDKVFVDAPVA